MKRSQNLDFALLTV